jgi:hypothetical protein
MSDSIPVLWPRDISVSVRSPLAILRAQADPLEKATKGYLRIDIFTSGVGGSDEVVHMMDLVAVPLNSYRYTLLGVTHKKERVYPATIEATCFAADGYSTAADSYHAFGEDDFIAILGRILNSQTVRSVIDALLAKINEESESKPPEPATA